MTSNEKLKINLGLPPISQIGVVVRDVDETVKYYSSVYGLGPFTLMNFEPNKHWYKRKLSHLKLRQGKTRWGNIELELMQPLEGKSLMHDFLKIHGEGLNHLGFNVRDYDEKYSKFIEAGFKPLMEAESYVEIFEGYVKAVWFDTYHIGGVYFEIIWKSWLPECQ